MIRYMLDTNMIAYAKKKQPACALQRLIQHDPSEICISSITMAELEFGIFNSSKPNQNRIACFSTLKTKFCVYHLVYCIMHKKRSLKLKLQNISPFLVNCRNSCRKDNQNYPAFLLKKHKGFDPPIPADTHAHQLCAHNDPPLRNSTLHFRTFYTLSHSPSMSIARV